MTKRIRIAALMEAYSVSGPAKNLIRVCRLIRTRQGQPFEISVVTFNRIRQANQPATNEFIEAIWSADVSVDVIQERCRFDTGVLPQLRDIFRDRAPDIVQTHGVKAHFLARLTKPKKARWLAYHHGYTAEDLKMRLYNKLDRWSLRASDCVVTVCHPFADMLARTGIARNRIRVLPNSIEPTFTIPPGSGSALRKHWKIPGNAPVVLAVGRLSREKGHCDLVEAARILQDRRPGLGFHTVIVGDGPERRRLEKQIAKYERGGLVTLAGRQQNPMPYYGVADVFVLPSYSEGSPNVLLEAMACSVPIVACAVGGVPEMVEHEHTALLVEPGRPTRLAEAIERLLTDPRSKQNLQENAQKVLRSRYSPEIYCDALAGIYSDLLNATT